MKILKPGIVPDIPENKGKCAYCGCEFEFFTIEAKIISAPWGERFFSVKCPQPDCWAQATIPIIK
jgi:hypothetical protein